MAGTKQITVRMPIDLLERLGHMPKGKSAPYIIEAVRERLDRERESEIEAGLQCLAFDDEANDLTPFAEAQSEVMSRVD
jgi:hypothetical protein